MNLIYETDLLNISNSSFLNEEKYIKEILPQIECDFRVNLAIKKRALSYIEHIVKDTNFAVEQFLQKYSLSTEEGVAIICLAESLIRIPDQKTSINLVIDKLSGKSWVKHISFAKSRIVELSSIGIFAVGKLIDFTKAKNSVLDMVKRISDPIILKAIKSAIKFLGKEFIIGYDIESGFQEARKKPNYLYSFDLLGESSRTETQATSYYNAYIHAIDKMEFYFPSHGETLFERPNLSVKLSALFPRVELLKIQEIEVRLMPRLIEIIRKARDNRITVTFDAEECRRQDVYLYVLTKLILREEFKDYSGIGFVVQAYQKRAASIIDYVIKLSKNTKKHIPLRLVKGAYWDTEIKYAQENGFSDYPVFIKKEYVDANYLFCARKIFENRESIYAQFATHNAYTAAYIIELFGNSEYEMQKLFGMGNSLYDVISKERPVRIYAPIGKMEDLLAYLMRRLLENGANTSFVNKVNSIELNREDLVLPIDMQVRNALAISSKIKLPKYIYENRYNSLGIDLGYIMNLEILENEIAKYSNKVYTAGSIIAGNEIVVQKHSKDVFRPGNISEKIGEISYAKVSELKSAIEVADKTFIEWAKTPVKKRAEHIKKLAELMEENKHELYSLLIREGGKSLQDAIGEVREAIDFCNYYSIKAEEIIVDKNLPGVTGERNTLSWHARGVFLCISPWNFPLAIFLGQIVAALVAGNTVLCKPADQTSLIANYAIKLLYNTGMPRNVIQLLLAKGSLIGETVVSDERIKGVAFTGSNETAKSINLTLAHREGAIIPLIAETGGQNAMIVDSSALLEQVCDDVIASAFYSAGQRCSALRVLYVQEEIYEDLVKIISGAMEELKIGDTFDITNDIGPVIDDKSKAQLAKHIEELKEAGFNVLATHPMNNSLSNGYFFYPHIMEINSINDLKAENFGPILHVCKYKEKDIDKVIDEINNYGYGLTFGVQSRIDHKIESIASKINVGNIYVNRSTIGAQVESHPFGGENKSGTGFKAGGPHYLLRFMTERAISVNLTASCGNIELLK